MASLKTITLYTHRIGPNPWKVAMILNELNLPYESKYMEFSEMKEPDFLKIDINGRVPAIVDPNTGISVWESGAILEYLVETYDKEHRISFQSGTPEYFQAKQWLHFQMSGQGPYFGQAAWFTRHHPEKVESARVRYVNEIRRVSGVLNSALEGKEYLIGGKYSYIDSSFVIWYHILPMFAAGELDLEKDYPNLSAWLERLKARPAISSALQTRSEVSGKK